MATNGNRTCKNGRFIGKGCCKRARSFDELSGIQQNAVGIGGKLYRQGLIKMNEFVTLCERQSSYMVWIQDTTGIDVGDDAERAELLGLGQSAGLFYRKFRYSSGRKFFASRNCN